MHADLAALVGVTDEFERVLLMEAVMRVHSTFFKALLKERKPSLKDEIQAARRLKSASQSAEHVAKFLLDLSAAEASEIAGSLDYDEDLEELSSTLSQLALGIRNLIEEKELQRRSARPSRGRKSHKALGSFALGMALTYQRYSGRKFTFLRHRDHNGKYQAVTEGHRFVVRAADAWLGTVIDPNSLAMECERVKIPGIRPKLRQSGSPRLTPKKLQAANG
jgi:hypothetical protein